MLFIDLLLIVLNNENYLDLKLVDLVLGLEAVVRS